MTTHKFKPCWKKPVQVEYCEVNKKCEIATREGIVYAYPKQDVLIMGVQGEIYPCKKDIFERTYMLASPFSFVDKNIQEISRLKEMKKRKTKTHVTGRTFEKGFDEGWNAAWYFIRQQIKKIER